MVNPPQCERNRQELRKNLNQRAEDWKKDPAIGHGYGPVYAPLRRFDLVLFRGSIRALTDLSADLVVSICSSGVIAQMTEKLKGLREPVVEAKGGR